MQPQLVARQVMRAGSRIRSGLGLGYDPITVSYSDTSVKLRAQHISGFVQAGGLEIFVRPKFLREGADADGWAGALERFVSLTGSWERPFIHLSGVGHFRNTPSGLRDIVSHYFAVTANRALNAYPLLAYERREAHLAHLKGRLLLQQQIVKPAHRRHRLACSYTRFDRDNDITRLLKWAAHHLARTTSSAAVRRKLDLVQERLAHVSLAQVVRDRLLGAQVPKQFELYREPVRLAKILLQQHGVALTPGGTRSMAFVLEMPRAFEAFVQGCLRRGADRRNGEHARIKRRYGLAQPIDGRSDQIWTEPDHVLEWDDRAATIVADSKYKHIKPDGNPSASDCYQVLSGCLVLDTDQTVLVYPGRSSSSVDVGHWMVRARGREIAISGIRLPLDDLLMMSAPEASREVFKLVRTAPTLSPSP